MKGILGRKVGMTQVFTDQGINIPVTVIEVQPNTITKVITVESDGYDALQLGIEDRKASRQKKPQIGHFKKANTAPKKFVKEIRGMSGDEYKLGATIDASIFTPGQLVDVIGNSKGKGFAGAIKRHNQSIGPKSHGGGGGSQPVRLTGSLGDIAGNKVVKGMTMPGQMGNQKATQQNLEVVAVDTTNNVLLVKGSIPGPNKSFVVVREAVKLLPSKEAAKLVDFKEAIVKNELLAEAQSAGADINTDMSVEEMKAAIAAALEAKAAAKAEKEAQEAADKLAAEAEKVEAKAEELHAEAEKAKEAGDTEAAAVAEEKAAALDEQAKAVEAKVETAKAEVQEAHAEAEQAKAAAEELQVEAEVLVEEAPEKEANEGGDE